MTERKSFVAGRVSHSEIARRSPSQDQFLNESFPTRRPAIVSACSFPKLRKPDDLLAEVVELSGLERRVSFRLLKKRYGSVRGAFAVS
jgi:hypothetical protein